MCASAKLRRTTSTSLQSCQGYRHLELLLLRARTSFSEIYCELVEIAVLLRSSSTDCTAAQDIAFEPRLPGLRKWETPTLPPDCPGQSRPTEDTENAAALGRTRAAAPCLLRTTTSGAVFDEKLVINLDDNFDGGFYSESTLIPASRSNIEYRIAEATSALPGIVIIVIVDRWRNVLPGANHRGKAGTPCSESYRMVVGLPERRRREPLPWTGPQYCPLKLLERGPMELPQRHHSQEPAEYHHQVSPQRGVAGNTLPGPLQTKVLWDY